MQSDNISRYKEMDNQSYPPQPVYPPVAYPQAEHSQAGLLPASQPPSQAPFPAQVIAPGQAVFQPVTAPLQQIWTTSPQTATCPYCQATGQTTVRYEPGAVTWVSCMGICLLGGWAGCCLIPFCIQPLQDCIHMCSACGRPLGKKSLI